MNVEERNLFEYMDVRNRKFRVINEYAIMPTDEISGLLVAQGFDGMEFSGFPGREDTEEGPPNG